MHRVGHAAIGNVNKPQSIAMAIAINANHYDIKMITGSHHTREDTIMYGIGYAIDTYDYIHYVRIA